MGERPPSDTPDEELGPDRDVPLEGEKYWRPRIEAPCEKRLFELEHDFARLMSARTGKPVIEIVREYTSEMKWAAFYVVNYYQAVRLKPSIDTTNLLESSYANYLEEHNGRQKPEPYHIPYGARFGCMGYDLRASYGAVAVHFDNAEYAVDGPFTEEGLQRRRLEMRDMFATIKERHPDVETVMGNSWLYNLEAYRSLFPDDYLAGLHPDFSDVQWGKGSTIWGQFMDRNGRLKVDEAEAFLTAMRELPDDAPLSEVFKPNGPVLPPLITEGPISDFYELYGIV